MEISDKDIISAIQREKNEEVGENFKIEIYLEFSKNLTYKKKDGAYMILLHYLARHIDGEIKLNEEYSNYKWVDVKNLNSFEPKIKNIPKIVTVLLKLRKIINNKTLTII